jgi:hypothetical protein
MGLIVVGLLKEKLDGVTVLDEMMGYSGRMVASPVQLPD